MMVECTSIYGHKVLIPKARLIFRPSVYAIIRHEGKVVVIRSRHSGKYSFPGGGIEIGERIEAALKREVKEEVGLEVAIERFAHVQEDFFYYDPSDKAYHSFLFYYLCTPLTFNLLDDAHINDDDAECPRWIATQSLGMHDFLNHGDSIVRLLASG